jgi:hypothetical protein
LYFQLPDTFGLVPTARDNIAVELDFVNDFILLANSHEVFDNFWPRRVNRRPLVIGSKGE